MSVQGRETLFTDKPAGEQKNDLVLADTVVTPP